MKIQIPGSVQSILNEINNGGFEAYIVGGCVRDFLLGRQPNDWDITTSASPYDIKKLFNKTVDTGIKHGTVTVIKKGVGYEVTTYRVDGEYTDCRHPSEVTFTSSLEEDLKRRDFTINAMAYHPVEGLVDLFGGEEDLKNGIIRAVGCAHDRFNEDALRMMRAIRFAAQLNYEIEPETLQAIRDLAPNISHISAERINTEMTKLLVSDHPYKFKLFYDTGLSAVFMPEFDKAMETPQNHPHHMYNVGEHILHSVENIENDRALRLTMLFHDIAKSSTLTIDENGITHFHGHPEKSGIMAGQIMRRLKYDNDTIRTVEILSANHDRNVDATPKAVRRAMRKLGDKNFELLLLVKHADVLAQSMYLREEKLNHLHELKVIFDKIKAENECFSLAGLAVTGKDLIAGGIAPGKEVGAVLDKMLEDVIEEPCHNDRDYLMNEYVYKK